MTTTPSRPRLRSRLVQITVCLVVAWTLPTLAQEPSGTAQAKPNEKPNEKVVENMPPLPADAHTEQTIQLNGKPLKYTVTVGTLPLYGKDNKKSADVVFTAFTVEGRDRPVTFALNGGPGAASVYLDFGAIGPKRVAFGDQGDSPSDSATLTDNPGTWLDLSRSRVSRSRSAPASAGLYLNADDTKREFYSTDNDIHYLSRAIYDWLVKNERLTAKKYLVGESYGGYRGPRITHYLQTQFGRGDERRRSRVPVSQSNARRGWQISRRWPGSSRCRRWRPPIWSGNTR